MRLDGKFGVRLRQRRLELGLSQPALGDKVGVSGQAISNLERGVNRGPSGENLQALARALHVNPEWLISGKGEKYDLPPQLQRIADAMQSKQMDAFDLAAATGGRLARETVELWLSARKEPTEAEMKLVEGPLGIGQPAVSESHGIGVIYDVRGEPVPKNLSDMEIDVVRWMREMGADRRNCLHSMARDSAHAARDEDKAISKSKRT